MTRTTDGARPQRSTTTRDRDRASIRRGRPDCGICGGEIDYSVRSPHPDSFEVDHIVPLTRGGADTLENKQASHRRCNQKKAAFTVAEMAEAVAAEAEAAGPRSFVTERSWS